jgi:transcriptional regulator with XRE-family HTH domain
MKNSLNEESSVNAILEIIGKKLTQLRIDKGFTSPADFAAKYDLPKIQYWRMEKGKANVTLKSLSRITAIHNLSLDQFFRSLLMSDARRKAQQSSQGTGTSINDQQGH